MASGNDNMRAARETYTGFLGMVKVGTIVAVITGAVVVLLIA